MEKKFLFTVLLAVVVAGLGRASALAETREFLAVTGEWSWKANPKEAPVTDRDRGAVKEIERYTFDPSFIVVNRGDTVILKIHALKGDKHIVTIPDFKVPETIIMRGEEKSIRFVANKAGVFEFKCTNHVDSHKEGPMVGYIYVFDKK
jgi:plastocyanin